MESDNFFFFEDLTFDLAESCSERVVESSVRCCELIWETSGDEMAFEWSYSSQREVGLEIPRPPSQTGRPKRLLSR